MLTVTEIFHSIQGESTWAGWPCTFVRLTGCGLRCRWCDSAYAFHGGNAMTAEAVVDAVAATALDLVEVTGGEPLEQEEFFPLATRLIDRGYTLLVETGGHVPLLQLDPRAIKIVDFKAPGSRMEARNRWENLAEMSPRDEIKIVCANLADVEWGLARVTEHDLDRRFAVSFSAVWDELSPADLAEKILTSRRKVRLGMQIHKILWGETPGR